MADSSLRLCLREAQNRGWTGDRGREPGPSTCAVCASSPPAVKRARRWHVQLSVWQSFPLKQFLLSCDRWCESVISVVLCAFKAGRLWPSNRWTNATGCWPKHISWCFWSDTSFFTYFTDTETERLRQGASVVMHMFYDLSVRVFWVNALDLIKGQRKAVLIFDSLINCWTWKLSEKSEKKIGCLAALRGTFNPDFFSLQIVIELFFVTFWWQ